MKTENSIFRNETFRTITVFSTGLGFGVMLGSLALIRGRDASGFQFGWSWWTLAVFAAAVVFNRAFWRAIFRAQDGEGGTRVGFYLAAAVVMGVGAFLYPIRFRPEAHYWSLAIGLVTAALFLGGVGTLLYKVGTGIFAQDLKDGEYR